MKNGKNPDPNVIHPVAGYDKEIYVKPTITNPNIIVGDFTYIADSEFESHVTNLEEINSLIPILTCSELEKVRKEIEARLYPSRRQCGPLSGADPLCNTDNP